jgi:hypothetical protein
VTATEQTRRLRYAGRPHQLVQAAHRAADHGMAVFPIVPGTKYPAVKEDWQQQATTNHDQITATWRRAPFNVGIATGPSGLLIVDLEQPKNPTDLPPEPWRGRGCATGADVLAWLATEQATSVPRTAAVTTPSGGRHLYFRQPPVLELGNTVGRLGWKIDTRGHGGYVLAPGSTINGRRYRTTTHLKPQDLPDWISTALTTTPQPTTRTSYRDVKHHDGYALAALTGELDTLLAATEGHRNDALNRAAFVLGQLTTTGLLDPAIVHDELVSAAGRIGLPRREAERTIASGLTAGTRHPRHPERAGRNDSGPPPARRGGGPLC